MPIARHTTAAVTRRMWVRPLSTDTARRYRSVSLMDDSFPRGSGHWKATPEPFVGRRLATDPAVEPPPLIEPPLIPLPGVHCAERGRGAVAQRHRRRRG